MTDKERNTPIGAALWGVAAGFGLAFLLVLGDPDPQVTAAALRRIDEIEAGLLVSTKLRSARTCSEAAQTTQALYDCAGVK